MTEEITPEDQALFERVRAKPWQPIVDALGFEARGEPVPDDVTEAVNVAAMWLCASALVGAGADADDVARQFVERDYVIRLGYKRDAGDEAALDEFSFTIDWTDGGDPLTVSWS